MNKQIRILYVDDNRLDRELVKDSLGKNQTEFHVIEASSYAEFEKRLAEDEYDIVLTDFNILGFGGLQVLDIVHAKYPHLPVMIVTGTGTEETAVEAMKRGAVDYVLKKPAHIRKLPLTIRSALEKKRLEDEHKQDEEQLRLLYLLVQEISFAEDFTSAIDVSLRKICESTGWVMGEAWIPTRDGSHLECSSAWYGKSGFDNMTKFREVSKGFSFMPGVGIPGRAWTSRKPVWDTDVTVDSNFPRSACAVEAGLKAAMATPVLSGDDVVAVLDFFVMKPMEEDKRQVELVSTVAAYLGVLFQRKRMEWELRKLFLAVEQSPVSIFITDQDGDIEYVNPRFTELTGYKSEEIIGKKPDILTTGSAAISDTGWRGEFLARKKSGEMYWEYSTISPVLNDKGEITNFIGITEDITGRKKAEDALRESEERFRATFNQAAVGIAHVALDGRWLRVNRKICDIVGYKRDELMELTFQDITYPEDLDSDLAYVHKILSNELQTYSLEKRYIKKGGSLVWINLTVSLVRNSSGEPQYFISVVEDISPRKKEEEERRKAEEQVRQLQKMEAIGQLAGGIAHDFNNILNIVIGYAGMLKMKMDESDPLKNFVDEISEAGNRGAGLTHQILAFSRKQVLDMKPENINDIVRGLEKMLRRLVREDIIIEMDLHDKNLVVMADAGQIGQVIINLVNNARDAMPKGGRVIVSSDLFVMDKDYVDMLGYGSPGEYALLTVSDTGYGMDARTQARIFEPFFTTKEKGKGTGLGLAVVHGIVNQHNGYINVYSEVGKGAIFRIYLPLIEHTVEKAEEIPAVQSKGGTETILVAEDSDPLREFFGTVLQSYGYKVITAIDGEDAINKFTENRDSISLALLDGIMPKKNGKEVYDAIKALVPQTKVIFMSGYAEDEFFHKGIQGSEAAFIQKPVGPNDLLKKVREILDK